jgi:hypothetical protein
MSQKPNICTGKLVPTSKSQRDNYAVEELPSPANLSVTSTANKQGQILEADFSTDSSSLTEQRNSEDHYSIIRQRLQNRPRSPSYIEHVTSVVRLSLSESSRSGSSLSRAASSLRWTVSSRSSWMSMSSRSTNRGFAQTPLQSLDAQPRQGLLTSSRKMF